MNKTKISFFCIIILNYFFFSAVSLFSQNLQEIEELTIAYITVLEEKEIVGAAIIPDREDYLRCDPGIITSRTNFMMGLPMNIRIIIPIIEEGIDLANSINLWITRNIVDNDDYVEQPGYAYGQKYIDWVNDGLPFIDELYLGNMGWLVSVDLEQNILLFQDSGR